MLFIFLKDSLHPFHIIFVLNTLYENKLIFLSVCVPQLSLGTSLLLNTPYLDFENNEQKDLQNYSKINQNRGKPEN